MCRTLMTVQQLRNAAPHLVPIRLDITLDGTAHVRDTFCISSATPPADIEQLATRICIDNGIQHSPSRTQAIVQAIQKQLDDSQTRDAPSGVQLLRYTSPSTAHHLKTPCTDYVWTLETQCCTTRSSGILATTGTISFALRACWYRNTHCQQTPPLP